MFLTKIYHQNDTPLLAAVLMGYKAWNEIANVNNIECHNVIYEIVSINKTKTMNHPL